MLPEVQKFTDTTRPLHRSRNNCEISSDSYYRSLREAWQTLAAESTNPTVAVLTGQFVYGESGDTRTIDTILRALTVPEPEPEPEPETPRRWLLRH